MEVIDRLIAAVYASGLRQKHIAYMAGISPTKLNKILKRKQLPNVLEYIAIALAIHLDPGRLLTNGELAIELDALRSAHAASQRVSEILGSWLPEAPAAGVAAPILLPKPAPRQSAFPIRAAANPNAELIAEMETEQKRIPRRAWNRGARIIARAHGDSMDGGLDPIKDGELVYLKPTRSPRTAKGHVALVRVGDGIYLKGFEKSGYRISLVSENGDPMELDARRVSIQIYGIVVDRAPVE